MKKRDYGHLKSQKFAALIFCVFVIVLAAMVLTVETVFSTLVMGVVALYTAFVGGRSFSDAQALRFGNTSVDPAPAKPAAPSAPAKPAVTTKTGAITAKEKEDVD